MPTLPRLTLETDSVEYEILFAAAWESLSVPGNSCEIGVRKGGSSELIMLASFIRNIPRFHIAIDPWDSYDYPMSMGQQTSMDLTRLAYQYQQPIMILPLYSQEFFAAFPDGLPHPLPLNGSDMVPVRDRTQDNQYSLVHFDGLHTPDQVAKEIEFFATRTPIEGRWIFDDIRDYLSTVRSQILDAGFICLREGENKADFQKVV